MATTTSFKQQCPSCEAMVPIRDPGLIGRKIDCPKCKYRFVVEKPAGDPDADADGGKANGKTNGKAGVKADDTRVPGQKRLNGAAVKAEKPAAKARISYKVDALLAGPLGTAALDAPGAFRSEGWAKTWPFSINKVKRVVTCLVNTKDDPDGVFTVWQTDGAIDPEQVKAKVKAE